MSDKALNLFIIIGSAITLALLVLSYLLAVAANPML